MQRSIDAGRAADDRIVRAPSAWPPRLLVKHGCFFSCGNRLQHLSSARRSAAPAFASLSLSTTGVCPRGACVSVPAKRDGNCVRPRLPDSLTLPLPEQHDTHGFELNFIFPQAKLALSLSPRLPAQLGCWESCSALAVESLPRLSRHLPLEEPLRSRPLTSSLLSSRNTACAIHPRCSRPPRALFAFWACSAEASRPLTPSSLPHT